MKPPPFVIPLLVVILALSGCSNLSGGSSGESRSLGASDSGSHTPTASDSEIKAAIREAFRQDPQLAAADISIQVEKGVVTLSGNTPNAQTYNRAISLARNVAGVRPPVNAANLKFAL